MGLVPGVDISVGATQTQPLQSVNAVVTSPPYANQRQRQYGGIADADYPAWTVAWMDRVRPRLVDGGNIAIVIRPHVKNGEISDYVLRTRLAVRDAGWHEIEELIWIKPSAAPLGHARRPRRSWESILWFSTSSRPYCDPAANGAPSRRLGITVNKGVGGYIHGTKQRDELRCGTARCRDYVAVPTAASDRSSSNNHPAPYPQALAEWIIRLLCPPDGVVSDPFMGSGTTAVAAKNTGRRFVGSDINAEFVAIARKRLRAIPSTSAELRR